MGLIPAIPQKQAGIRIEPPVSLPSASGTIPVASAAAEPPLDPPGTRSEFQGFSVLPSLAFWVVIPQPNSWERVAPTTIAPAFRHRATAIASDDAMRSARIVDP